MYEAANQTNSIILAGIVLMIYEAIIIITFYFLSPIVMMILYAIFTDPTTVAVNGSMYASEFYAVTVLMFAVAFLIPVVWFVLWVFRVESGYQVFGVR